MKWCSYLFVLCSMLLVFSASSATAGVTPSRLNYQGLLTDPDGQPVNATGIQMTFRIWAHPYSSDPSDLKWEETMLVDVVDGLFNVILGDNIQISDSVFAESERFLGIQIGSEPEGSPRTRLVQIGYSTRVETLDGARGGVISGSIGLQPATTKEGSDDEELEYKISDESGVTFYANSDEVYTPCLLFSGDDSRQCTAAVNSGVAQGEDTGASTEISNSPTVLAEKSIETPADGFVLVLGSCEASLDLEDGGELAASPEIIHTYSAAFGVSTDADALPSDQQKRWSTTDVVPYLRSRNVITVYKVFEVSAGLSTFYFMGQRTEGDLDFTASDKTITLVYIPKAYGDVSSSGPGGERINSSTLNGKSTTSQNAAKSIGATTSSDEIAKLKTEVAELRAMLQQVINGNGRP